MSTDNGGLYTHLLFVQVYWRAYSRSHLYDRSLEPIVILTTVDVKYVTLTFLILFTN